MLWHMLSYLGKGWLETHYSGPTFYFRYPGFEWVPAIPQELLRPYFWGLAALSAMILFGVFSRLAAALFALGFSWVLLLDTASYQNHL